MQNDNQITLNVEESASFIAAVKAVVTSAGKNKKLPILSNVLVDINDQQITLSATNSYILTIIDISCASADGAITEQFHVDARDLIKAVPSGAKNLVTLETSDAAFVIKSNGQTSELVKQPGDYPNVESLTAGADADTEGNGYDYNVDPGLMSTLIKQAETFRGKNNKAPVKIKAAESTMKPIHIGCVVVGRGQWRGLIMPVRVQ